VESLTLFEFGCYDLLSSCFGGADGFPRGDGAPDGRYFSCPFSLFIALLPCGHTDIDTVFLLGIGSNVNF
jgi:hypothetical protein